VGGQGSAAGRQRGGALGPGLEQTAAWALEVAKAEVAGARAHIGGADWLHNL